MTEGSYPEGQGQETPEKPDRPAPGRMSPLELKAMLTAEKLDALAAMRASKLSAERTKAMDYYNGDMSADMPAQDGRSRAVSSDVADTVEGLMPSLMEIFAGTDEVVRFEPVGPEDVPAAEQESDYVNHVFMQQNPGFLILYSFIKDALLSKVGIVKVWWEEHEEEERETFYDLPDDAFALLADNPDIEIIEHSARPDPAAKAAASYRPPGPPAESPNAAPALQAAGGEGAQLGPVPGGASPPGQPMPQAAPQPPDQAQVAEEEDELEDEQLSPQLHDVTVSTKRNVQKACVEGVPPEEFGISRFARNLKDCGYCFHEVIRRSEDLVADGYDADQVKAIPTYTMLTNPEELARDTVDEHLAAGGDEGINEVNRQVKITEHYIRMDYEGDNKPALYRVTTGGDQGEVLRLEGKEDITRVDAIPFAAMTPVIVTHRFFGKSIADLVMDIQRIKTALFRAILDNAYLAVNPRVEVSEAHATETTLDDLLVSRPGGIVRTKMPGGLNWQTVPAIAGEIFPVLEYADQTREWRTGVSRQQAGLDAQALQNQSATAAMQSYNASQGKMKLIARIFAETGIRDLFSLLHGVIRKNGSQAATVQLRKQWVTVDPRDWKTRNEMTINVGLGTGGKAEQLAQVQAIINLQKEGLAGGLSNLVKPKNLYNSAIAFCKLAGHKNYSDYFSDPDDPANPAPQPKPDPKLLEIQAQSQADQAEQQIRGQIDQQKVKADSALAQQRFDLDSRLALLNHELKVRDQQFQHLHQAATAATAGEGQGGGNAAPLIAHLVQTMSQMNGPKRVVRDAQGRVSHVEPMPMGGQ
jgi:hypothetical protein